ncbi:hypothetical protein D3C84_791100 [compost metagenome]
MPVHRYKLNAVAFSSNLPSQVRARNQPAAEHDVFDTADFAATSPVFKGPDFAVGVHRYLDHILYLGHPLPMCWRLVAVNLGPCMHHQLLSPAFGQRKGAVQGTIRAVEAQAHLGRHRNMRRHGAAHLTQDGMEQLRLLEQHRPTAGFVHGFGRATEVQVDHRCTQLTGQHRILCQANRIRTEQLHTQGHPGRGLRTLAQFRRQLVEGGRRQQPVADANELGDTPIDTAHLSQDVTKDVVDQPLHRGQGNLHGLHLERKRPAV